MSLGNRLNTCFWILTAVTACSAPDAVNAPSNEPVAESSSAVTATVSEYKLPAYRDAEVLPSADIELWAALHRPETLTPGARYPLLVFVHGNHETCRNASDGRETNEYAETGMCPGGDPLPNHRGYDYIASDLASRGYFVLEVNTNRGVHRQTITPGDPGHIRARGRVLLRHLEKLTAWHSGVEATPASLGVSLQDRIDFTQVGLMGHSQGGEAVRLAYNEYRASGSPWPARIGTSTARLNVRAIFEIGPTDGKAEDLVLNADGTRWAVLLPGCDMDLTQPQGSYVFNRAIGISEPSPAFKATYRVYGANHNFYNSEWRQSDYHPVGCINQERLFDNPALQRESGRLAAVSFFSANVGATRDLAGNRVFDPQFPLSVSGYRVHRGYHTGGNSTYSLVLQDFTSASGTSYESGPGVTTNLWSVDGNPALGLLGIDVTAPSSSAYVQANFRPSGSGVNLNAYRFLDFRVELRNSDPNDFRVRSFTVELVNANGTRSAPVAIGPYVDLVPPPRNVAVLQTARIPLTRFSGANRFAIRGVRLVFADPALAGIALANVRATRDTSGL
jgi:hypothetical protein